jgi:GNAT superfamily N-acetyltransferase
MTSSGGFRVRPATEADVAAVAAMVEEFEDHLNTLANHDEILERPKPAALTAEALRRDGFGADPWFSGLLAEQDGAPVGYMLYHFGYWADRAARTLVVADLFVRETARGQGAGTALMHEAARILRQRDGSLIVWTVWDRNPAAIAFYQRLGVRTESEELLMLWPSESWPAV